MLEAAGAPIPQPCESVYAVYPNQFTAVVSDMAEDLPVMHETRLFISSCTYVRTRCS